MFCRSGLCSGLGWEKQGHTGGVGSLATRTCRTLDIPQGGRRRQDTLETKRNGVCLTAPRLCIYTFQTEHPHWRAGWSTGPTKWRLRDFERDHLVQVSWLHKAGTLTWRRATTHTHPSNQLVHPSKKNTKTDHKCRTCPKTTYLYF